MEFNLKKNIYVYGNFKDVYSHQSAEREGKDLIVYVIPKSETARTINSLEGFFISEKSLDCFVENPELKNEQVEEFEKKYCGKFYPFEKIPSRAERINKHYENKKQRFG